MEERKTQSTKRGYEMPRCNKCGEYVKFRKDNDGCHWPQESNGSNHWIRCNDAFWSTKEINRIKTVHARTKKD